jgi:microcystin-dependent protein
MTIINVFINQAGSEPFNGTIEVSLKNVLNSTNFITVPVISRFPIVNGTVTLTLAASENENIPYFFTIYQTILNPGDPLAVPPITPFNSESIVEQFQAVVPDSPTPINFSQLARLNGIFRDNTDTAYASLSRRIYSDSNFWLGFQNNVFKLLGAFIPSTFVYRRGNIVRHLGASWICINPVETTYFTPEFNPAWVQIAEKGAPGVSGIGSPTTRIVGELLHFAGGSVPQRWLRCDGSVILRTMYPDLFTMIGTTYNTGSETVLQFRLPDLRGRCLTGLDNMGSVSGAASRHTRTWSSTLGGSGGVESVTLLPNQIPSHTHASGATGVSPSQLSSTSSGGTVNLVLGTPGSGQINLNASTGNTAANTPSGISHENLPPHLMVHVLIYTGVL